MLFYIHGIISVPKEFKDARHGNHYVSSRVGQNKSLDSGGLAKIERESCVTTRNQSDRVPRTQHLETARQPAPYTCSSTVSYIPSSAFPFCDRDKAYNRKNIEKAVRCLRFFFLFWPGRWSENVQSITMKAPAGYFGGSANLFALGARRGNRPGIGL